MDINTKEFACSDVEEKLIDRYEIYLANTASEFPMTFDEWLNA